MSDQTATIRSQQSGDLLDSGMIRLLERLSVVSHQRLAGRMQGDRRSPKKGAGIEFADFRGYSPGDDYRRVDWNLYARTGSLFLKLFTIDEDRTISIILDCSRSMSFGNPEKSLYSRRIAAALAYIGLIRMDRVKLVAFSGPDITTLGPLRGRASFSRVIRWLGEASAEGDSGLGNALQRFTAAERFPGIAFVISDFFEDNLEPPVRGLAARGFETNLMQVLSPQDIDPDLVGDLNLVDSETGDSVEITVSSGLLARYKKALSDLQQTLIDECRKIGFSFISFSTAVPVEELFSRVLQSRGLIR